MIDLHNHILHGIDDGARDLNESLEMARQAVAVGTIIMAATPHRFYQGRESNGASVREGVQNLQRQLDRRAIPLKIIAGIEIPMKGDTAAALRDGRLIPLGGKRGRFALIEPPFDKIPPFALSLLTGVQNLGLTPILAHPERNGAVQKDLTFVEECAGRGMIIQLTAGAIIGKFGEKPEECAREIALRRDWQIIIASDAHNQIDRTPSDMVLAEAKVAEWIGDAAAARRMTTERPQSLL